MVDLRMRYRGALSFRAPVKYLTLEFLKAEV